MCLGFPYNGFRFEAKNIGSYKEPKYSHTMTNTKTGKVKQIDANYYNKGLNLFKKSRRK